MSNVKENVIRIVNGLPPLEPKNLVDVKPDEVVVKAAILPPHIKEYADELKFADDRNRYIDKAINDLAGGEHPALTPHEDISDPTGYCSETSAQRVRKPYVKFKMLAGSKYAFIVPREGFWPAPLPKIVL